MFGQRVLLLLRFLLRVREGAGFHQPTNHSFHYKSCLDRRRPRTGKKNTVLLKREKITS